MAESAYNQKWTPEEDEALRMHYPTHGRRWDGWKTLLPNRTSMAIIMRANVLGLKVNPETRKMIARDSASRRRARRWTKDEEAILAWYFPRHPVDWKGWDELLPNRSRSSIRTHAYAMGLTHRGNVRHLFSKTEKARLLKTVLRLSDAINATPYEVAMELVELGKEWERQVAE